MTKNFCFQCSQQCVFKEEKNELFGFPCDSCRRVVCSKCTGAMASEVRVIPSTSRTLLYMCPECLESFRKLPLTMKKIETLESDFRQLREEMECHKKSIINKFTSSKQTENIQKDIEVLKKQISQPENVNINNMDNFSLILKECFKNFTDTVGKNIMDLNKSLGSLCINLNNNANNRKPPTSQAITVTSYPTAVHGIADDGRDQHKLTPANGKSKDRPVKKVVTQGPTTVATVASAVLETLTAKKMNDIIYVNSDAHEGPRERPVDAKIDLIKAAPVRTSSGHQTNGTRDRVMSIAAAQRRKWFYIGNLDLNTNKEELCKHLNSFDISIIDCEKLQVRNNNYAAAFKVAVTPEETSKILDSEIWPKSVAVKPYIFNQRDGGSSNDRGHQPRRNFYWRSRARGGY